MKNDDSVHKGGHFKKYLNNTPWYLLSSLTTKGIGFLLIPLYTNYLTPQEFGTLATLESFSRILPIFLSLYLDAAFARFYFLEKNNGEEGVSKLYSTHFWFLIPWALFVSIFIFLISDLILNTLPDATLWSIAIILFTQILNQLSIMVTMIWNANLMAKKLAIFQISISISAVLITIFLLAFYDVGWESRLYALVSGSIFQLIILLIIAIKNSWLKFQFSTEILTRSLRYSIPLVPNVAAGWIAMFSDRMILAYYGKIDEVGVYSVAAQLALVIYVVNDALTKVQGPIAMSGLTLEKSKAKNSMVTFLLGYLTFLSIVYSLLVLFSREVIYLFTTPEFYNAYIIVSILGLVYFTSGVYRVFTNIISFHNATWIISIAAFIQAIINVILNFMFIPMIGMYAAALSTLISMLAYTIWIIYWSQKLERLEIKYSSVFKILGLMMLLLFSSLLIDINNDLSLELVLSKVVVFIIFIFFLMTLESSENFRIILNRFKGQYVKK